MKFNFVSIPKTGTQSLHTALGTDYKNNHKSIKKLDRSLWSFSIIREPTERLYSWWAWHRFPQYETDIYQCSFEEWVEKGCPHHWRLQACESAGVSSPLNQYEYVVIDNEIAVDYIGDFAQFHKAYFTICNKLGIKKSPLPWIGKTENPKYKVDHTTIKLLQNKFQNDYALYELLRTEL